jgi:hypothetical protein
LIFQIPNIFCFSEFSSDGDFEQVLATKRHPSRRFVKLIEFSGLKFTQPIYELITHLQSSQLSEAASSKQSKVRLIASMFAHHAFESQDDHICADFQVQVAARAQIDSASGLSN